MLGSHLPLPAQLVMCHLPPPAQMFTFTFLHSEKSEVLRLARKSSLISFGGAHVLCKCNNTLLAFGTVVQATQCASLCVPSFPVRIRVRAQLPSAHVYASPCSSQAKLLMSFSSGGNDPCSA